MTSYVHASLEWRELERESVCFTTSHVDPAGGPCLNFISLSERASAFPALTSVPWMFPRPLPDRMMMMMLCVLTVAPT